MEDGNPSYLCEDGVLFNHDITTLMLFPVQSDKTHYDIPATVTDITPAVFQGSKLKSITLPPTLTKIGNSWLSGCAQLESISIPATVTAIGNGALSGCSSLTELYVSNKIQSIGTSAFSGCTSLVKVHLPDGLTRIEGWTFDGCSSLSEVNIPDGLNYIGMCAFRDCGSLPVFQIPQGVTTIDQYAFLGCRTPKELVIPDKVEYVGWDAFKDCSGLEDVTIGRSVTTLAGGAFSGCDNIWEVWSYIKEPFDLIDYDDPPLLGKCFSDVVTSRAILHVPKGTTDKYQSKRGWRDFQIISEMNDDAVSSPSVVDNNDATLYDMGGRRLKGKPMRGLYIQNGKKLHVK